METKTIKETKELLAAVELVAIAVKKIMKDGKIDLADASVLVDLGLKLETFIAAVEGMTEIQAEVQEIDLTEAKDLVNALYTIAKKVQEV